ncbi:MAG: PTS IIA-like nitrogen regulatory protein PtsN [Pseudomonadota bacterium]
MDLSHLLTTKSIAPRLKASSKKQALQALAAFAADRTGASESAIFECLLERERLGSTGVGGGIAIPHGKLDELEGLVGVLARLDEPIDFEAVDEKPVDILFLLLAPKEAGAEHLKALACVSRFLRDQGVVNSLRGAESADALFAIATARAEPDAA